LYEVLDSPHNDYLFLVMENAELGQLSRWHPSKRIYERNEELVKDIIKNYYGNFSLMQK
jgi:hypothetical protein